MKNVTKHLLSTASALVIIFISSAAFGQFSVRAWGGYGIESGKSRMHSYAQNDIFKIHGGGTYVENPMLTNMEGVDGVLSGEVVRGSYGSGINTGLAFGYQFTDIFSAELGVSYLFGKEIKSATDNLVQAGTAVTDYTSSSAANVLYLKPALVFTAPFQKVKPYARFGAAIGIGPKIKTEAIAETPNGQVIHKEEVNGGAAIGVVAALGVEFPVTDKISVFGEAEYTGVTYTPSSREITELTIDGSDALGFYSNGTVHTLTDSGKLTIDPTVETERLKSDYLLSNLSFNLGVKFAFGGAVAPRGR